MTEYPTPWSVYDPRAKHVYGHEAKCYEHAVFDIGTAKLVGSSIKGSYPGYTGRDNGFKNYGLIIMVRQFKEYVEPAPKKPEKKKRHVVRIDHMAADGSLTDRTLETRMVYFNSKGAYVKTRSNGNPRISFVDNDGTYVIEYRLTRVVYGRGTEYERATMLSKPVLPKEIISD